jgi:hypothetical protein
MTMEEDTGVDRPVRIVHLRQADMDNAAVRTSWQQRGYATLGPVEGHDPYQRCPVCSTDEPGPEKPREDCAICGQGPCALTGLPRMP